MTLTSQEEKELRVRIIESAKVLLDFNYRLGVEESLRDALDAIISSDDPLVVYDDIAEGDPDEAIYVMQSGLEMLFHGHRMHSAKAELAMLRKKIRKLS